MIAFHRSTGAKATILLTPVADPSRYGLVRTSSDGRVDAFLEKPRPEEIDTDLINAGLYVLEPEVLELVPPGRSVSIERDVFPRLAAEGSVFGIALPGYWLDVGTPETYLQAHRDVLERIFETEVGDALGSDFTLVDDTAEVHADAKLVPPVYVGPGAVVRKGARLGSLAVLGAGARLAEGGVVENAVVGARTRVGPGASVVGSIVGDDAELGAGCELRNLSVVGHGARVGARQRPRPRPPGGCWTAHPGRGAAVLVNRYRDDASQGREALGLGARVGRGGGATSGKLLFVRAGESLSLQYHEVKDESWLVQEGRARLELGEVGEKLETFEIVPGDAYRFRPRTVHRVTAVEDTLVVEVSTNDLTDVVRLEDKYGREGTNAP